MRKRTPESHAFIPKRARTLGFVALGAIATAELASTSGALAAQYSKPSPKPSHIEERGKRPEQHFRPEINAIATALAQGKIGKARTLASELRAAIFKQLKNADQLLPLEELSVLLEKYGEQEEQIATLRFLYENFDREKSWRKKFEIGEDLARVYLLSDDNFHAKVVYEELYQLYQQLIHENKISAAEKHTQLIYVSDQKRKGTGEWKSIEPYLDLGTYQQYLTYRLRLK